jgi:hypothetical protein
MIDEEREPGPAEQRELDIITLQRAGALLRRLAERCLGWSEVLSQGELSRLYLEEAAVARGVGRDVAALAARLEADG